MRFPDLLMMSVNNLRRRKLRTFLTVLGVIIGTASIVVMVSLGIGLNEMTMEQIASWGSLTTIEVYANDNGSLCKIVDGPSLLLPHLVLGPSYITDEAIADFQKIPLCNRGFGTEMNVLMRQGAYEPVYQFNWCQPVLFRTIELRRRTHPGFWRNGNGFWKWCTPAFYQCENR